ncbi:helix-turn-helix transcriptional regulator [Mesorhizobium sp. B2-3-5]|uniref:helix-turn-helix domain-containing protein n=1 Tax=Mesorhizobium sp. B2-3-5 TaxID=2589958 RepID=UPI001129D250|nr:helix-turn-helix transcriptional regulator [Mesorhizobium sp. B2-3-5]TPM21726.1 helix-turn-helix transcriptional regulator [Mesorhizobium sp. B2-3-5]
MEVQSLVAWNLRRLRVERGISQDDLALTAGVERAYVGYLERGARNPTIVTLSKLADALSIHISQLFREPVEGENVPTTLKAGRKRTG